MGKSYFLWPALATLSYNFNYRGTGLDYTETGLHYTETVLVDQTINNRLLEYYGHRIEYLMLGQ